MLRWLWLSLVIIIIDQITKYFSENQLDFQMPVYIAPFLDFTLMHNTGAAFSFLHDAGGWQRWFFIVLALAISLFFIIWLSRLKAHETLSAISLSMIIGGAIGNVIDRFYYGYVVDFLHFHFQDYYWPAFNIADSAITLGVMVMLYESYFFKKDDCD